MERWNSNGETSICSPTADIRLFSDHEIIVIKLITLINASMYQHDNIFQSAYINVNAIKYYVNLYWNDTTGALPVRHASRSSVSLYLILTQPAHSITSHYILCIAVVVSYGVL